MAWLDRYFSRYNQIQSNGVNVAQESILNFLGATVADDPANQRTNVTVTGSSGASTTTLTGNAGTLPSGRIQVFGYDNNGAVVTATTGPSQIGDVIKFIDMANPTTVGQFGFTLTDGSAYAFADPGGQGGYIASPITFNQPVVGWILMTDSVSGQTAWRLLQ